MGYDSEFVNEIAGYIALAAVVPLTLTCLIFGVGSPWWKSRLGRAVFSSWTSELAVFTIILLKRFLGPYPGYEWVAIIGYSMLFVSFTAQAVVVILERRPPAVIGETTNPLKRKVRT
jgi:hypothetical protein